MAHYYFDLHECGSVTSDPEGRDFASLDAARAAAVRDARAVMCGEMQHGRLCMDCHIDIKDVEHRQLVRLPFADAVEIRGR